MDMGRDAIDALEELGLTEYEARCFVGLAQLPHGTAKEIADVADVPRSRVYETMDRLQQRGLVELHDAEPREYQSVSVDTAVQILRNTYESHVETVEEGLRNLEPTYKQGEQAAWALNTPEQVTGRIVDLIAEADAEILFILAHDPTLTPRVRESLAAANARGVAIHIGTPSTASHDHLHQHDFDARLFTTDLIDWFAAMQDSPYLGRLLMVDREPVLVSAIHDEVQAGIPRETAMWTDGTNHGFATFAERVFTYELHEDLTMVTDAYPAETPTD